MKKIIYIVVIFPVIAFAQETVKKTTSSNGVSEVYYVLKSDKKIKHGSYKKIGFGNFRLYRDIIKMI